MNINNLQSKIKVFEDKVSSTKGRLEMTEEQYISNKEKLDSLKELQMLNSKAIEILNLVQTTVRERIKNIFETTITYALQFIHQSNDYKFELEFDRRGNVPKLQFLLKTPDMQEAHDIMSTRAGGSKDIVALALRFVLLEISKYPGFIFLDEPFKRLDSPATILKAIEFIKENQKASGKQMFIITHEQEVVDSVQNPIILQKKLSKNDSIKCPQNNGQIEKEDIILKKKRGRPKKEKQNEIDSKV
jgi:energy-coupling factor transporter ATP-binding protein EcfA2